MEHLPIVLAPGEEVVAVLQELLARGKCVRMRVHGWSMHPTLRDGDIVWIEPVSAHRPRLGDVVLYRTLGGRPVVHRLRRRAGYGKDARLYIEGDHDPAQGEWVRPEQVLGVVRRAERAGRDIRLYRFSAHLSVALRMTRWATRPLVLLLRAILSLLGWD
ncbi:MAG: S24/S26 family peptidase [Chloroflexia bacterium]